MQKRYFEKKISQEEADRIRLKGIKQIKYFNKVYLHVSAAAKMLSHARFGEPREVMGLLQGNSINIQDHITKSKIAESSLSLMSSICLCSLQKQGLLLMMRPTL